MHFRLVTTAMIGCSVRAFGRWPSFRGEAADFLAYRRLPSRPTTPLDGGADHPEKHTTIATIQAVRAQGKGFKAIARLLEAKRIPCRDQRWHHTTVRFILRRARQLAELS